MLLYNETTVQCTVQCTLNTKQIQIQTTHYKCAVVQRSREWRACQTRSTNQSACSAVQSVGYSGAIYIHTLCNTYISDLAYKDIAFFCLISLFRNLFRYLLTNCSIDQLVCYMLWQIIDQFVAYTWLGFM